MNHPVDFHTDWTSIQNRIDQIDPIAYGKTRNFIDGSVTYLSPYISRGVISSKQVLKNILNRGYHPNQIEKFIQELAWRDYWQLQWDRFGSTINMDIRHLQTETENHNVPKSICQHETQIQAIDDAIKKLYQTGYMHNHIRMYTAALACNIGKYHWLQPAKWMYYHLLDADWASNALSWQWVAGTNSHKKYIANQENINKYCHTSQSGTYLDTSYEILSSMPTPHVLKDSIPFELQTHLPESDQIELDHNLPVLIYNFYNLDPEWHKEMEANRVLLLEPSVFNQYPISDNSIKFMLELSELIPGIQIYVGEFSSLKQLTPTTPFIFKKHPLNKAYTGLEEKPNRLFDVEGHFTSFFSYWKKCKRHL